MLGSLRKRLYTCLVLASCVACMVSSCCVHAEALASRRAKLETLRSVAAAKGISPNQLVLAWMLHSSSRVVPLVTGSNAAQLEENLKAAEVHLTPEDMETLDRPVVEGTTY